MTEEEQEKFGLKKADEPITLIRSDIRWGRVSIDSAVLSFRAGKDTQSLHRAAEDTQYLQDIPRIIFINTTAFSGASFAGTTDFRWTSFVGATNFSHASFAGATNFSHASFAEAINFRRTSFAGVTNFRNTSFLGDNIDFRESNFSGKVDFVKSNFSGVTNFKGSFFSGKITSFHQSSFEGSTYFSESYFIGEKTSFLLASFRGTADFSDSYFKGETDFGSSFEKSTNFIGASFAGITNFSGASFAEVTNFSGASFAEVTNFSGASFAEVTNFSGASFAGTTNFSRASFVGTADFSRAQFDANADFRNMRVTETLRFDGTTWGGRLDFRGMSAKELLWDNTKNPAHVKGVIDLREALVGSATFKEVRFQDLVDFSRTTFGQYKVDLVESLEALELMDTYFIGQFNTQVIVTYPSAHVLLENNTFEKEVDLLQVTFDNPAIFINNRFRSTLDLTGATFEPQNPATSNSQEKQPRLCLSFNRINRLVLEPELLSNPPRSWQLRLFRPVSSLIGQPLEESKIRPVLHEKCASAKESMVASEKAKRDEEPLDDIYKALGQSFRKADDREGINEAWYLQTVAKWRREPKFWASVFWLFGDIPSRYSVDVWRTVWMSFAIMVVFYFLHVLALQRVVRKNARRLTTHIVGHPATQLASIHIAKHAERQRTFRFRLFEPIGTKDVYVTRTIRPWYDALSLTGRAFLKLGLGTRYPTVGALRWLIYAEWALGVFMLIHFILAVKNNLPFVLPFLGVAN